VVSLELLGTGVIVAWLALPVLARAARPRIEQDPVTAYRRMFAALALSAACLTLPWLREQLPRLTDSLTPVTLSVQVLATPVGGQQFGAMRGYAVSPFDLLGLLWVVACGTAATRWAVARLRLTRLLRCARSAPEELQAALARLARARGIEVPRLLLSHEALAPFSLGTWRPTVLLPVRLAEELPPEHLALVLQHELAHLVRRDPLTHALARLCTTLFAFHPSVPGLMRELTLAREAAVDAEVAREDRHAYASLLLQLASHLRFGGDPAHVSMDDTALARRIALLTSRTSTSPGPSATPLLLAAAGIGALGMFAPHVFAEPARFHTAHALADPMALHEAEVDQCYELARAEDPELVVSTRARFEVDPTTFHVTAADVPTPQSPVFQRCVEGKAMTWSFPPPPFAPPPPKDVPAGAKAMVAVQVEREP
jgi:beta-lactamase regulating signal transducer with metallopeptidase domain